MVVQHNIPALNSHRFLGVNNNNAAKNLEKLSSGYKINRAGDDAAGLAISEKMRGQIRGLAKAEDNTSNAINLIQTAEGGMQELHNIAQRMREIAVQATNGTYHDEVDREALDLEFQELKNEFDRITDYTNYNGIKLLNGDPYADGGVGGAGGRFTEAAGDLTDIAKGFTGATVSNNTAAIPASTTVTLKYKDDGSLDIGACTATGFTFSLESNGNLTLTNAGGVITLDGDWSKANASYMKDTQFTLATTGTFPAQTATVTYAPTNANTHFKDVTGDFKSTAMAANEFTFFTGSTGTNFSAGDDIGFELIYGKNGKIDLEAMNKAVAGNTGKGEATRFEMDEATGNLTVYISDGAGGIGMLRMAHDYREVTDNVGKVSVDIVATANLTGNPTAAATFAITGKASNVDGEQLVFQVGANGTKDQQVYLTIHDMHAEKLGLEAKYDDLRDEITEFIMADNDGKLDNGTSVSRANFEDLTVADLNVLNANNANVSIQTLTKALDDVSLKRAELGAVQNRLEYTLNNLGVTKENLTASESTIRDTDMAKEMMEFTKNSILIQSAQAMLAQANTLPQGVLQLLR